MATVFVAHEPKLGPRGFTYDISPALAFGQIMCVFDKEEQPSLTPVPSQFKAQKLLREFSDEDYILWAGGDPAALAIVIMTAAKMNHGRVKFLRWERDRERSGRGYYIAVNLNV